MTKDECVARVRALVRAEPGMKCKQIAKKVGVPHSVMSALLEEGVPGVEHRGRAGYWPPGPPGEPGPGIERLEVARILEAKPGETLREAASRVMRDLREAQEAAEVAADRAIAEVRRIERKPHRLDP